MITNRSALFHHQSHPTHRQPASIPISYAFLASHMGETQRVEGESSDISWELDARPSPCVKAISTPAQTERRILPLQDSRP